MSRSPARSTTPAATASAAGAASTDRAADPTELWLLNGEVLVYVAGRVESREAIGIRGDRIVFVGDRAEAEARIPRAARVVDLAGRTVMPGIVDAHMHGKNRGISGWVPSSCDLGYEGGTVDSVLGKLRAGLLADAEREHLRSDFLFVATNLFAPAMLPAGTTLTRDHLDRLSAAPEDDEFGTGTTRPIVVYDKGVHSNFANSRAIANAGVDELPADPGHIGRDAAGRVTGVFNDFPGDWGKTPPITGDEDYRQRCADLREANRLGITAQFEAAGTLDSARLWAQLADDGELTMRVNQSINVTGWIRGNSDRDAIAQRIAEMDRVRRDFDGHRSSASPGSLRVDTVKVFADGEAEYPHQTAAMLRPYRDNVGTADAPEWVPSDRYGDDPSASDAHAGFLALDRAGWNIHVHCLGDRSARETLDNFADIARHNPAWDRRHTICHVAFIEPSDIARMAELGVVANMSLQWARRDAWTVDAQEGYIASEQLARAYPARELADAGVTLSGGSDWPVDPLDPWLQMQLAVTRESQANAERGWYAGALNPAGALTAEEAVMMHTLGGAYQMHREHDTGSIAVGKLADVIVVDRNPVRVPASEIAAVRVDATLVGGQLVHGELPE